jgi:hypothetical protein
MILESLQIKKRFFDPKSKQDMAEARHFFKEMSWGKNPCPFLLEFPYESVPSMIKDKIVHHALGIEFDRFHHIGD